MRGWQRFLYVVVFVLVAVFTSCGGGGSSSGSGNNTEASGELPRSTGTFSILLASNSIQVAQGSNQTLGVQIDGQNGFSGSVTLSVTGLPDGVIVSPAPLTMASGASGTLTFQASPNAVAETTQFTITAVSGSLVVENSVSLNVIGRGRVAFTMLGGNPVNAFYDESRRLLFTTNLSLNEVDVLSGGDLVLRTRISVPQPLGIDQMPDGNTLVVGTLTQAIYTIDEDTLAVTQHLAPNLVDANLSTVVLPQVAAMVNGKVLIVGKDVGIYNSVIFGGQQLIEWDSTTGQFSHVSLPGEPQPGFGEIFDVKRSGNHERAIFVEDEVYLYDAGTDKFIATAEPALIGGVRNVAANPLGTQFAVASSEQVTFYDAQLNVIGTSPSTSTGLFVHVGLQYSSDGTKLYWELYNALAAIDVLNTSTFEEEGNVTSVLGTDGGPILLWVDSNQQAYFSESGGIGTLNCSRLRATPPSNEGNPAGGLPSPFAIPVGSSTPVTYTDDFPPPGTIVTFGGIPGSIQSSNPFTIIPPPSSTSGLVDVVFTEPDGEVFYQPQGFSYGPNLISATATMAPPTGNPMMALFGYGILDGFLTPPSVSVGGLPAGNVMVNGDVIEPKEIYIQVPDSRPGPADITVSSTTGTATLSNALTYIPSSTIIPATGLLQLIYDPRRSLVYALKSTEIDVLNPTTLEWQSSLHPTGSSGADYTSMALTPDDSKALVVDSVNHTLTIFALNNPSQTTEIPLPAMQPHGVVVTNTGKAFIASGAAVPAPPIEFDLSRLTYTVLPPEFSNLTQFAATADGTRVAASNNDSRGMVAVWNSSNDSWNTQGFIDGFWTDVAISLDGNTVATVTGGPGFGGVAAAFFDNQLHYLNSTFYPEFAQPVTQQVLGSALSPSGRTLVVPTGDSIEFFNVASGVLLGRLLTPEPLPVFAYPNPFVRKTRTGSDR